MGVLKYFSRVGKVDILVVISGCWRYKWK